MAEDPAFRDLGDTLYGGAETLGDDAQDLVLVSSHLLEGLDLALDRLAGRQHVAVDEVEDPVLFVELARLPPDFPPQQVPVDEKSEKEQPGAPADERLHQPGREQPFFAQPPLVRKSRKFVLPYFPQARFDDIEGLPVSLAKRRPQLMGGQVGDDAELSPGIMF